MCTVCMAPSHVSNKSSNPDPHPKCPPLGKQEAICNQCSILVLSLLACWSGSSGDYDWLQPNVVIARITVNTLHYTDFYILILCKARFCHNKHNLNKKNEKKTIWKLKKTLNIRFFSAAATNNPFLSHVSSYPDAQGINWHCWRWHTAGPLGFLALTCTSH